jgi:RNA polymerase sigma-70 factor (ECF subfamily)
MSHGHDAGGHARPSAGRRSHDDQQHELFEAFFRDTYSAIVKAVMYAGASLSDAEDATSNAMVEAFLRWSLLENPDAWVRTAAVHNYINNAQRERRRPLLEAKAVRLAMMDATPSLYGEEFDERARVTAALRTLPATQRKVMALAMDGLDSAAIAEFLRTTPANVRSNLRHARASLRRDLKDFDDRRTSHRERSGGGQSA